MTIQNFFFIDSRVENQQAFVTGLQATDTWVLLNADQDGLDQMVRALSGVKDLASIQIISHGSEATLTLGSTVLNLETVRNHQVQLAALGASLAPHGDIQLYGCDVAQGAKGEAFVKTIAQLTQADVAASKDLTGAAAAGGNWTLEYAVGHIDTSVLVPANYSKTLDTITGDGGANNLVGTSGNDTVNGLGGNDTIDGQAGSDVLNGGDGDDKIEGNFGNDSLYGGNGNDTLTDDQGSNILDGGAGNDSLTSRSLSGDHSLLGGTGNDSLNATGQRVSLDGGDQDDYLSATGSLNQGGSSSYVLGGTATLNGGSGTDNLNVFYYSSASLDGGDGNDSLTSRYNRSSTLLGGAGDDVLYVYSNADTSAYTDGDNRAAKTHVLDGGDDNDSLTVSAYTNRWYGQTTLTLRGGAGNDSLSVTDDYAGDTGNSGQSYGIAQASLDGGAGDDTLNAGGVLQLSLTGGAGADSFILTAQQYRTLLEGTRSFQNTNNTYTSVSADPVLITDFAAGVGGDVLDYSDLLRNGTLSYDGSNPFGTGFLKLEQLGADTLLSFDADGTAGSNSAWVVARFQNLTASSLVAANFNPNYPPNGDAALSQTLTGSSLGETLTGGFGNDTVNGLGGNDTIDGQAGSDVLNGGDGDDKIEGNFGNDSLYGGNGNDTLTDDQGSNILDGGAGNDSLTSRSLSGDHSLLGGTGNDSLNATGQRVSLDGGDQDDYLSATGSLNQGGSSSYVLGGTATLNGGSGTDNLNVFYYSSASLDGGDGNDSLTSRYNRSSTLLGGAGDDVLYVYSNADTSAYTDGDNRAAKTHVLDGGDDNDSLTVSAYTNRWYGQTTLTLRGGAGNDSLSVTDDYAGDTGNSGQSYGIAQASLDGGAGDDTLNAGGVLQLSLTGGAGADSFILTAQQYRTLLEGTRSFQNTNNTYTSVSADPVLITDFAAGVGGDVLDYSDLLRNGTLSYDGSNPFGTGFLKLEQLGADTLLSFDADGTAGSNSAWVVARFQNLTASSLVAANFNPNYPPNGDAALSQTLTGSSLGETLTGGFGNDTVNGLGGNDTIDGQAGSDVLNGGDGDDKIEGNFGNDSLYGGNGNDTLTDDQGSNILDGGAGNDSLTSRSLSGDHSLLGGTGNDSLNATGQRVSLDGGDQDDYLSATGSLNQGGSSSYVLGGTATLNGGSGTDNLNVFYYSSASLDGGDGNDSLTSRYNRSSTLLGGAGDDVLYVYSNADTSAYTDGDNRAAKTHVLDGGDDNDSLTVSAYTNRWYGQTTLTLRGGAGNDSLSVTDDYAGDTGNSGQSYGIAQASLDGGAGDDTLNAGGVLQLSLTGGAGADSFILTAQQYRTLLEGTRSFQNTNNTYTSVSADPVLITDFAAGVGGDVLDYSDLLRNGTLSYDGSNPFGTGFLKLEQLGADTLLSFDADGTAGTNSAWVVVARFQNLTAASLVAANFNPNFGLGTTTPPANRAPVLATPTAVSYTDTSGNDTFSTITGNLSATDADGNTLSYGISGGTVSLGVASKTGTYGTLSVNTSTGAYSFSPNDASIEALAANTTETFTVTASDGSTVASATFTVNLTGVNETGTIVSYSTPVAENSKTVTTLAVTDALLGTAPKYSLSGLDASLFKVSSKGVLTFATAKDYEQPVDADKDGVYEVSVTLTNAKTKYAVTQDLTVGVEFVPIDGTAGADTLKGTAGWDTLDGLAGDDKLTGGAGLDTFLISSGRDMVLDFNALTKGATGSEVLQVSAGATAEAVLKAAWVATSDSFNDGTANLTTKGMAVDLSGITQGQGWNVTNKGAATTITGSLFNDVLTGGTGSDTLLGGAGNDELAGGKGLDTLTGGAGNDTFRFGGDTKTDHITDFLSGTDRIELDNLVFKTLLTEGQLSADQFAQGTAATTATQRIFYDQPTGNLWYDVDGSGKKAAVLMAVLDNHVQIAHTDFWVI